MGLQKILSLLEAEDNDVRIHAVKVVANLAAEGDNISLSFLTSLHCCCHITSPSSCYNYLLNLGKSDWILPVAQCFFFFFSFHKNLSDGKIRE